MSDMRDHTLSFFPLQSEIYPHTAPESQKAFHKVNDTSLYFPQPVLVLLFQNLIFPFETVIPSSVPAHFPIVFSRFHHPSDAFVTLLFQCPAFVTFLSPLLEIFFFLLFSFSFLLVLDKSISVSEFEQFLLPVPLYFPAFSFVLPTPVEFFHLVPAPLYNQLQPIQAYESSALSSALFVNALVSAPTLFVDSEACNLYFPLLPDLILSILLSQQLLLP